MTPVSLRLRNFMSYGDEAPELDFRQFHTACLSGNNGQGKSALLDAITWALWGKARKSPGNQAPHKDLLRLRQNEVQVTFEFELDGDLRYRAIRTYNKSRERHTLELHRYDPERGFYALASEAGLKETERKLTELLGLEYTTFINSALLLQGRSDEFATRSPTERKKILATILGLDRYKVLQARASTERRKAQSAKESAKMHRDELSARLKGEGASRVRRSELKNDIEECKTRLEAAQAEEGLQSARLGQLESLSRDRSRLEQERQRTEVRRNDVQASLDQLQKEVEQTAAFIASGDEIRDRYDQWCRARDKEGRLQQLAREYRSAHAERTELEKERLSQDHQVQQDLHLAESELRAQRKELDTIEKQEQEEPAIQRSLQAARRAREELKSLEERKERIEALNRSIQRANSRIASACARLEEQVASLTARTHELSKKLAGTTQLEAQRSRLETSAKKLLDLTADRERINAAGTAAKEKSSEVQGLLKGLGEQRHKAHRQLEYLSEKTDGECPTCGTQLTPDHRSTVESELVEALAKLDQDQESLKKEFETHEQAKVRLRDKWQANRKAIKEVESTPEALARVKQQLAAVAENKAALSAAREEKVALEQKLSEKAFATQERTNVIRWQQELEATPWDAAVFEKVRFEAAQVARYKEFWKKLNAAVAGKAALKEGLQRLEKRRDELSEMLRTGIYVRELSEAITTLTRKMEGLQFDQSELDASQELLRRLQGTKEALWRLEQAEEGQEVLHGKLVTAKELAEREGRLLIQKEQEIAKTVAEINAHAGAEAALREARQKRESLQKGLGQLQLDLGEINAKLERAKQDRQLKDKKEQEREKAEKEEEQFKHLVDAFSERGIPALIIEQALPELEDRTNELLEKLTGGTMHVRMDTTRDSRKGNTIETLDISVRDGSGEYRAYETFSGGEAFRVNFALRIALSRFLAARSNAQVRLLVIDEGFGTQDQTGVQHLVEAIGTVQKDFAKILVITHIPEVKEAFPVRIEVTKDATTGSTFDIIGV